MTSNFNIFDTFSRKDVQQKVQVWVFYRQPQTGLYFFLLLFTRPDRGSFWQPITGSVEKTETLVLAAKRETEEETGLTGFSDPVPLFSQFEFENRFGGRSQEHGFSVEVELKPGVEAPEIRVDPNEHTEYRWVKANEALQMVPHASNRSMLKLLMKQLALRPAGQT